MRQSCKEFLQANYQLNNCITYFVFLLGCKNIKIKNMEMQRHRGFVRYLRLCREKRMPLINLCIVSINIVIVH